MTDPSKMERDDYTGDLIPAVGGGDVLDLGSDFLVESEEADFESDPGTTDVLDAVENGEVYFPPTDPVVRPANNMEGLVIQGGFADTALDDPEGSPNPARIKYNDEDIADRVIAALRNDAYTTDLAIDVDVEDGVVYLRGRVSSLDDVEQAEEVAGRVDGVEDVEEELEIV